MNPIQGPSAWVFVGEESQLQENRLNIVFPKGLSVLLIKKSGRLYAISAKCAHMACSMGAGRLADYTLQCPCHDWRYDIRTGEFLGAKEIKIPTYRCQAVDGRIYIDPGSRGNDS